LASEITFLVVVVHKGESMNNTYPCFSCKSYEKPLTYFPGSENLLCKECSEKYYPTQQDIDYDLEIYKLGLKAGIL